MVSIALTRRTRGPHLAAALACAAVLGASAAAPAAAATSPLQEHPTGSANVHLLSRLSLGTPAPSRLTGVAAVGDTAFVGSAADSSCHGAGTYPVSIGTPSAPQPLGFVAAHRGSSIGGAIAALHLDTPAFRGDVLIWGNERCGASGVGGLDLVDVTDPAHPQVLAEGTGDRSNADGSRAPAAHDVHSVAAWSAGGHAFVVALDDDEAADVDIFDITDPRAPVLVSERGLADWPSSDPLGNPFGTTFGGQAFAAGVSESSAGGRPRLAVSYWDAGVVELDVSDPAHPTFTARSQAAKTDPLTGATPPEGNTARAVFDRSGGLVLASDQALAPDRPTVTITGGDNAGSRYPVGVYGFGTALAKAPAGALTGPVVYGGYGCDAGSIPAAAGGAVLVLQRGPDQDPADVELACRFDTKAANAIKAGYAAVLIANDHTGASGAGDDGPACGAGDHRDIVALCVGHRLLHEAFGTQASYEVPYRTTASTEPRVGARGATISVSAPFAGTGYAHLMTADTLAETDVHALADAVTPAAVTADGTPLAVLDVATDPAQDVGYYTYGTAGLRAVRLAPHGLMELGSYVPGGGAAFWYVHPHVNRNGDRMLLTADQAGSLWLLRYGAAKEGP